MTFVASLQSNPMRDWEKTVDPWEAAALKADFAQRKSSQRASTCSAFSDCSNVAPSMSWKNSLSQEAQEALNALSDIDSLVASLDEDEEQVSQGAQRIRAELEAAFETSFSLVGSSRRGTRLPGSDFDFFANPDYVESKYQMHRSEAQDLDVDGNCFFEDTLMELCNFDVLHVHRYAEFTLVFRCLWQGNISVDVIFGGKVPYERCFGHDTLFRELPKAALDGIRVLKFWNNKVLSGVGVHIQSSLLFEAVVFHQYECCCESESSGQARLDSRRLDEYSSDEYTEDTYCSQYSFKSAHEVFTQALKTLFSEQVMLTTYYADALITRPYNLYHPVILDPVNCSNNLALSLSEHGWCQLRRAARETYDFLMTCWPYFDDLPEDFLPTRVLRALERQGQVHEIWKLQEIRFPVGRRPQLVIKSVPGIVHLSVDAVTELELQDMSEHEKVQSWTEDGRSGLAGSLHRLSKECGRDGKPILLVFRFARPVYGVCRPIMDVIRQEASILFLGPPGAGKTTILREVARVRSDLQNRRVVVVDTSLEIGGYSKIPHRAIGMSILRVEVSSRSEQHKDLSRALQNLNPEVMVIDEIGSSEEVTAAAGISARGVQLFASAHAPSLGALLKNPILRDLVGGVENVITSDVTAKLSNAGSKVRAERKEPPVFGIVIEMLPEQGGFVVHDDVAKAVDMILAGHTDQAKGRVVSSKADTVADGAHQTEEHNETCVPDVQLPPAEISAETFRELAATGEAYVIRFDGCVSGSEKVGPGAAGAFIKQMCTDSTLKNVRAESSDIRSFSHYLEWTDVDTSELIAAIVGIRGFLDFATSFRRAPKLVVVQGDSKFAVNALSEELDESPQLRNTYEARKLASEAFALLRSRLPKTHVRCNWIRRKFNRRADRLAKEARLAGSASEPLPQDLQFLCH
eukprot:TRINITY_DN38128_c0_g1_i1.p1 TRINITY_DN38128_c0_g1~~TRINITY_DN38128_c0_g1_i1.p1  ORF type:complete len:917 (-),score=103.43 TRINITY_DN38128_c0_g1_i1:659-3409(-)